MTESLPCWFLYVVRTRSGTLYTGISTDPARRLRQHNGELAGGAKALRGKGPLQLVWQQSFADRSAASVAEAAFKKLGKPRKEQLITQLPE
ncbi:GIY-YIG nuclease family protein [Chromatiaceae bacterium AAb-1]|nr:GIY-YIG nuclease family protein [Chromatiaceae bacterium AAb-1]